MITKNAMQLKAFIKKVAKEKNISPQLVMQNYMLERLLERISLSDYQSNFIIKGGFLISSLVGLSTRATMDLDTTIKGFTLTHESIAEIFEKISSITLNDDISFELVGISDIRETDDYPGIRVSLKANYAPISVPLTVDVTTGDIITPKEIEYTYSLLFENRKINILAYNIETILAEKIETVISRNIANTRPRDYYDIYVLSSLYAGKLNMSTLKRALEETSFKRGSNNSMLQYHSIMTTIRQNRQLQERWEKYQKQYEYAKNISFEDACHSIEQLLVGIETITD